MALPSRAATSVLFMAALASLCRAQEWTESNVVQTFVDQSPQAREARARVAIAQAEMRSRSLYANPSFNVSREGAGFTEFFQAEQTLPVSGRIKLLRQAGSSLIRATEADEAFSLWQARSRLRQAFYRMLASQQREAIYSAGLKDIEEVIRVLRDREREGEGSKFDRLRTERERAGLLADLALVRSATILARADVLAFLSPETPLTTVTGRIETSILELNMPDLVQRAFAVRDDYRAEQRRMEQYQLEQRAAERLRFPEPVFNAGLKRAEIGTQGRANGLVVGITVPLPLFNRGQAEVTRFAAEQERTSARLQILGQQIRAAIEGSVQAFNLRRQARDEYRRALAETGANLSEIAIIAYKEGEIGILQLLDSYRLQLVAQLRLLDIQAELKEAQIELERVVGEELGK